MHVKNRGILSPQSLILMLMALFLLVALMLMTFRGVNIAGAQIVTVQVSTVQVSTVVGATIVPTIAVTGTVPATVPAFTPQPYTSVDPAVRGIALSTEGGLRIGEVALPGESLFVDFNPIDPVRFARVDGIGILRFIPEGGTGEGVYSFAPYFEGFSTASAETNPLFVAEVDWSPNGHQLAFIIDSDDHASNDGVWFWQPARDIGTDPSYHLLRDCPPGCNLVELRNVQEWESLSIEWGSDNQAVLVQLNLPENDRRGITVRQAVRDPETRQSRFGPDVLFYDYGSWTTDGQNIVVSGHDPNGKVVFGIISQTGQATSLTDASTVGLAWVQDAIQNPVTGQLLMLGHETGSGSALKLFDSTGTALTELIGNGAPQRVQWSPDRSAVLVTTGEGTSARHYIAQIDGTITDITTMVGSTKAIDWVGGGLPRNALSQQPYVPSGVVEGSSYRPGQQLRVYVDGLSIYAQPSLQSPLVGTVVTGEYVAILAGPVEAEDIVWWRIQSTTYTGWLGGRINGTTTLGP